jgi:hypothetical protein
MKMTESVPELVQDVDELFITHTQEIPQHYLDELRQAKDDFKWNLNGFTKVATIPAALADKWLNEGFDIYKAPANEILKRLRMEEYDIFATAGNRKI